MSSIESLLTGGVLGVAIGGAASTALEPVFEPVKQNAWKGKPSKILEAPELAQLVAEALNAVSDVIDDVNRNGYDADQFASLVQLALKAPGPPEAEKLYLRSQGKYPGAITLDQLHHAYGKAGLEGQWWEAMTAAASSTLLTPAELALGAVRSVLNDQGLLVTKLDTSGSNVEAYPVAALNIIDEAVAAGVDTERLQALIGMVGLPPSPGQLASAFFRSIITKGAYYQGIEEGDARPEWADVWLDQAREILTSHDYVEGYLRGWVPDETSLYALTAQWGMSQADTDLLFQITGRPIPVHRITQGLALGGTYDGPTTDIPDVFIKSLQESNIRPPWYQLAYLAEQYTWPAYFVLKDIVPDPISVAEATDILTYQGWRPDLAAAVAQSFATPTAKSKAATPAQLASQYLAGKLSAGDYASKLEALGYTPEGAADVIAHYDSAPLTAARTAILTKLRNGVVGGSISADQASEQLAQLTPAIPGASTLVALWQQEYAIEHLPPPASSTPAA